MLFRSAASGVDSFEHRVIGDNQARIVAALRDLLSRSDAVIVCGGLGPTQDDLTRDAIAEVMGVPLKTMWSRLHQARADFVRIVAEQAPDGASPPLRLDREGIDP